MAQPAGVKKPGAPLGTWTVVGQIIVAVIAADLAEIPPLCSPGPPFVLEANPRSAASNRAVMAAETMRKQAAFKRLDSSRSWSNGKASGVLVDTSDSVESKRAEAVGRGWRERVGDDTGVCMVSIECELPVDWSAPGWT